MAFIVDDTFQTTYEVWAATEDDFVKQADFRLLNEAIRYAERLHVTNKGSIYVRRVDSRNVYFPDGGKDL